jgi:hypothetical protein
MTGPERVAERTQWLLAIQNRRKRAVARAARVRRVQRFQEAG